MVCRWLARLAHAPEVEVVRDLRVYAQAADAEVFHYREKAGLEVDAVVQCNDGRCVGGRKGGCRRELANKGDSAMPIV